MVFFTLTKRISTQLKMIPTLVGCTVCGLCGPVCGFLLPVKIMQKSRMSGIVNGNVTALKSSG